MSVLRAEIPASKASNSGITAVSQFVVKTPDADSMSLFMKPVSALLLVGGGV